MFNAVHYRAQHDESGRRVPEAGIWDPLHYERGRHSFGLDHLMTLSFYNLSLTDGVVINMPHLGANLSTLSIALNCLTDQGLGSLIW